jgi:hypothetical protein
MSNSPKLREYFEREISRQFSLELMGQVHWYSIGIYKPVFYATCRQKLAHVMHGSCRLIRFRNPPAWTCNAFGPLHLPSCGLRTPKSLKVTKLREEFGFDYRVVIPVASFGYSTQSTAYTSSVEPPSDMIYPSSSVVLRQHLMLKESSKESSVPVSGTVRYGTVR